MKIRVASPESLPIHHKAAAYVRKANILFQNDLPCKYVLNFISAVAGPVSLLRRCMEEKLKVLVVIRAAVSVRSRCKGYVIAFDKHFNMVCRHRIEVHVNL